jgi:exodeoxyribonuclease VII large subunit
MRVQMNQRIWDLQRTLAEMQQVLAEHSPTAQMRFHRERLKNLGDRLSYAASMDRRRRVARLDSLERELRAVSAESVLRRGFSITMLKKTGAVIRTVAQVKGGDALVTKLSDGTIVSTAEDPKQPKLF